jgi:hypothetical protein
MGVLKVIWGLLVDDAHLATILAVSLVISFGVSRMHHPTAAALVIWLGLIVSLWISVEHQLQLKLKK